MNSDESVGTHAETQDRPTSRDGPGKATIMARATLDPNSATLNAEVWDYARTMARIERFTRRSRNLMDASTAQVIVVTEHARGLPVILLTTLLFRTAIEGPAQEIWNDAVPSW